MGNDTRKLGETLEGRSGLIVGLTISFNDFFKDLSSSVCFLSFWMEALASRFAAGYTVLSA